MTNTINFETVKKVLEMSKNDIDILDILSEFDDEQNEKDEEMVDFVEDNREEFEIFLNTSLSHIMDRLKIRMAFAKNGEDTK